MEQLKAGVGPLEYFDAFKVARRGKNVLIAIILLSILVQLAGVILVEFVGLSDAAAPPATQAAVSTPAATKPTTTAADAPAATKPATTVAGLPLRTIAFRLLPATKFTALAASGMLMLTLMFSVNLSLVGRLGGVAGLMRAFFLSVILLAMFVPWQQIMNAAFACGALFNLGQLEEARHRLQDDKLSQILHYARFIAYPSLALLVLIAVQVTFGKGCKRMNVPPSVTVAARPESPQQPSC